MSLTAPTDGSDDSAASAWPSPGILQGFALNPMDDAALDRLWLALHDERHHHRLVGRLRPLVVGWPHPRRRLLRLRGPLLRVRPRPVTDSTGCRQ